MYNAASKMNNDNGIYKIVIGIYSKKESIELMSSYFLDLNYNFRTSEIKMNNEFLKSIGNYELLIKTSEKSYYDNINNSLLKLFNEYIS